MPKYGSVIVFCLLVILVLSRVVMLRRLGIQAFVFAKANRSDLLLPPIVAFFVYHLFANVFDLPRLKGFVLFQIPLFEWFGLFSCILGLGLFLWGVISFHKSFRVGIDQECPGNLITTGAFALTRNPLYVAFALELIGFFLIFQNLLFLFALVGGFYLFHRQILREELFLKNYYGKEYETYCQSVHRYI